MVWFNVTANLWKLWRDVEVEEGPVKLRADVIITYHTQDEPIAWPDGLPAETSALVPLLYLLEYISDCIDTDLALFHTWWKTAPNVGTNCCGRSEFLGPTSKVADQTGS